MGRQAILAVVCWLFLSQINCDPGKDVKSLPQDNVSAASARLYRNVPVGVYASSAPHGAYSFHLPSFLAAPKQQSAASHSAPVKQPFSANTYLKDSYGNSFLASPQMQMLAYKTAFPQQYASIQTKLPEHLAQPLVAASPNFHFQQSGSQVFFGAPYRVPALQGPSPTPLHHFPSFGQLYGEHVKSLAPSSGHSHSFATPAAQHQSSSSKPTFTSVHEQSSSLKKEPEYQKVQEKPQNEQQTFQRLTATHSPQSEVKFQRIQEEPKIIYGEPKFQRLQEAPPTVQSHHSYERTQETPKRPLEANSEATHQHRARIVEAAPSKQTKVTYVDADGKKSVVTVETQPSLPLLDLTLLEPLHFDNPLVPQVQHFLPRIHQATYQKLPQANIPEVKNYQKEYVVSKTMSYDSDSDDEKPKKKQKKPTQPHKHNKKNEVPKKTTVTYEHLDHSPEIVYEIHSPESNYKETIKEKSVSYNKKTESEPIHYTYGSKSQKDPVTYSFSRSSKEPVHIKEVHYHGNGPSHLIYNFKPEEQSRDEKIHTSSPQNDGDDHKESSHESDDDDGRSYHQHSGEQYNEHPKSAEVRDKPRHNEQGYHAHREPEHNVHHGSHQYSAPLQYDHKVQLQPITQQYEEDIRLLTPAPNAQINVDPNQHVQPKSTAQPQTHSGHHSEEQSYAPRHQSSHEENTHAPQPQRHSHSSYSSEEHPHPSPTPQSQQQHYSTPHTNAESYEGPVPHIHEKSKRIIIQDESPDESHTLTEQMKAEMIKREENNEDDFEKAYEASAFGFPAYNSKLSEDAEKDIFDPESYGVPPAHIEFNIERSPFQQYQEEGDDFPKETRAEYKDARDKQMQNYYTDYAISKPESLLDRYQNKLGYYKLYREQKPDYLEDDEKDDEKKSNKKSAKFTVAPSFNFHYSPSSEENNNKKFAKLTAAPSYHFGPSDEKSKSYYGHHKPKEQLYEYDYSKGTPRDSSAFASRPYRNYKTKTSFVEPQFQYGFEPIPIPKLDSELAAMASNHSPESEKVGTRKKMYKENWYIKKTSTSAGAPAS